MAALSGGPTGACDQSIVRPIAPIRAGGSDMAKHKKPAQTEKATAVRSVLQASTR